MTTDNITTTNPQEVVEGPSGPTILVVEKDAPTRTFLADNLAADGYQVKLAATGNDARLIAKRSANLDLAVVDGSVSTLLVGKLVARGIPVMALVGNALPSRAAQVREMGASDVLFKPFSYPELRMRVNSLLRCEGRPRAGRLEVGPLELDLPSRQVRLHGRGVALSQKEFSLLWTLASEPTRVFTKEELLRQVWGGRAVGSTRTLDSHVCRLRNKLGVEGDRFITNVWGVGYRLANEAAS